MSILYDYLKVLEKKRAREAESPEAPIRKPEAPMRQKKSLSAWPYLAMGFLFLFSILVSLLFFRNINILVKQPVTEKAVDSQQVLKPASQDIAGINSNNADGLDFSLKGIIYNANSPSAIINGKLVEKNAKIDDWLVMDISPTQVTLENSKNNSQLTLKLSSTLE